MPAKQPTYRELQAELENVLIGLQADGTDVDEALKLYEQGLKLVEQLETRLKAAENRIKQLKAK